MFTKRLLTLFSVLLMGGGLVLSQQQRKIPVDEHGVLVVTPEMEEMARRRREMLNRPDFFVLKIAPENQGADADANSVLRYKAGSKIGFTLFVENTLTEPFHLAIPTHSSRPKLVRDGEVIPYSKKAADWIKNREAAESMGLYTDISAHTVDLQPNVFEPLGSIDLKYWYEPLEPGLYHFTLSYRFQNGGNWIDFPTVTFEVVPQ